MLLSLLNSKQKLVAASAIVAILGSLLYIYRTEFHLPDINVPLQESVGQAMADETARLLGKSGNIVVVATDLSRVPELKIQLQAFQKHLKSLGAINIAETLTLDPGEDLKYRPGAGLSAKRFLKIVRKHQHADAIVSFVGAPHLTDTDFAQLKSTPKLVAETHSPEKLEALLDKKILLAAVVPRFEFPAPGPRKPHSRPEWFDRYFQIIGPGKDLPKPDELQ